jgi:hypothetical protein
MGWKKDPWLGQCGTDRIGGSPPDTGEKGLGSGDEEAQHRMVSLRSRKKDAIFKLMDLTCIDRALGCEQEQL